jgi:hypothetical protein
LYASLMPFSNPFYRSDLKVQNLGERNLDLDIARMESRFHPVQAASLPASTPTESGQWNPAVGPGQVPISNSGRITILDRESERFTDARLLADLNQALTELNLSVTISDATRSSHATYGAGNSRHHRGKALDIAVVNNKPAALGHPRWPDNQEAVRLAQWFINRGYGPGEHGNRPGLLFGPVGTVWNTSSFNHNNHLHLSVP